MQSLKFSLLQVQHDCGLDDVEIAKSIMMDGRINALGLQIPVKSNWNHLLLDSLCTSRSDREVAMFLKYGWPLNRANVPTAITLGNHNSAIKYPLHVSQYISKELKYKTLIGPFATTPFENISNRGIPIIYTLQEKYAQEAHSGGFKAGH